MKTYIFTLLVLFVFRSIQAQIITTIAGNGSIGYSGDGGPATAAKFTSVTSVAVDNGGNVYISDGQSNVIRKTSSSGIISTFAGNDTAGFSGDNGPATAAKINYPDEIALDKKGNVYFYDMVNRRVRKVDALGIITTFAGNGTTFTSSGIPATATGISGGGEGTCIDALGNVYISMGTRILKVDTFGTLTIYAGNGVGGYTGDGGAATAAGIGSNGQIAIDADNNMYIAEASSTHSIIRKINAAGIISTVAGNGSKGFSGDGGPATAAKLNEASGVFPDNCGNFYISDLYNNRIRKVDGHGIINTIAGNGYGAGGPPSNGGYSGDGGPALAAELYSPGIIYLDKNSNIYIADVYNYRVRKITMDSCKSVMGVASPGLSKGEEVLSVFPNPNSGTFTINVLSNVAEKVDVVITNVVGVRVKELSLVTNREQEVKLNVPAGVYFISAATPNGKIIKRILVD